MHNGQSNRYSLLNLVLNNFYGEEVKINIENQLIDNCKNVDILISNYKDSSKLKEEIILRPYESIVYYIEN